MHYALLILSLLIDYILSFSLKAFLIRFVFIGGFENLARAGRISQLSSNFFPKWSTEVMSFLS